MEGRTRQTGGVDVDVDGVLAEYAAGQGLPSIALGIVRDGRLDAVHTTGTRVLGTNARPDADSVYRIASMTKSFTAATVLLLRDRGQLRLDDPVRSHLPWLTDDRIAIRDLLTMAAGLPTDDPWGDRHEPTDLAIIERLVAQGIPRVHPPRAGFEYSNLGFAILGRLITAVTGRPYTDVVTDELLVPLGMHATTFDHRRVPDEHAAQGYAPVAAGLVPEPRVLPGAFSPMGGLHSSLRDLAIWVQGMLDAHHADATTPTPAVRPHPLSVASRLEQQHAANFARLVLRTPDASTPDAAAQTPTADASAVSYAMGLMVEEHSRLGRFVLHSGGYPGFGSHMRWHPATGLGVIVLTNRTYGRAMPLAEQVLADLVAGAAPRTPPEARLWPATRAAMDVLESLLVRWDDSLADATVAHNVDLDQPRDERRAAWQAVADAIGLGTPAPANASPAPPPASPTPTPTPTPVTRVPGSLTSRTPAHASWRVTGPTGAARLELLMSPDPAPRVQLLQATVEGI